MKILAITNMYPSAAFPSQGIFVQQQIKGLRAAGLEVRVLLVDRWGKGPLVYYHWLRNAVQSAVAEFEPDVIHVMYGGVMADQVARRHHIRPVVVSFRGSDLLGENLSGWTRKIISRHGIYCSRRAANAADGVIVVASHLVGALKGAAPADKIHVIPSGIDLDRFKPADPLACKQKLGLDTRSFHVLFASNNGDPVKRLWLAKAAVAQISHRSRPVEFHYLTGIPGPEMPLWLNAGDALLLTSLHEGSPNIVKEALACGLPVVSVNVGDVAERIKGIEGCHLAAPEPAELAAKLDLVRQHGERLNCRARLEELSIQSVARKLKQVYEEITLEDGVRKSRTSKNQFSLPAGGGTERGSVCTKEGTQPKDHAESRVEVAWHQEATHS
ncbi:MAG TPA: glycosyltransferase [Candidatus Acidoferrum sp.]|nr:glycosyltransferase [Candidatus Acidoferrum sp.]